MFYSERLTCCADMICLWWLQVIGVMDAMPNSNLKPEGEDAVLESDRMYRTTYMFRCCSSVPALCLLLLHTCTVPHPFQWS